MIFSFSLSCCLALFCGFERELGLLLIVFSKSDFEDLGSFTKSVSFHRLSEKTLGIQGQHRDVATQ
jgi:hypothetical protein